MLQRRPGEGQETAQRSWRPACTSAHVIRPALLLCVAFSVYAQIQDLATTADGGQVYFSTPYRLKGSADPGYPKIYRYAEHGFELFREFQLIPEPSPDTNFFMAERPSVSADGQTVAFTAARNCAGGSHCIGFVYFQSWIAHNGAADASISFGRITLSPNARFALVTDRGGTFGPSPIALYDLSAGAATVLANFQPIGDGRYAVANDGAVLLLGSSAGPVLWRSGAFTPVQFEAPPTCTRLSANDSLIVYESDPSGPGTITLRAHDISTGREIVLISAPTPRDYQPAPTPGAYLHPTLTYDGRMVAYTLGTDLFLQRTDGAAPSKLASAPEGFQDAVISGFGNVVYASTVTGRLLKIEIGSGSLVELSAAPPHIEVTPSVFVPGARVDVAMPTGSGDAAIVTEGGLAPVIARSESTATFEIPWETPPNSVAHVFYPGNPSAFEEAHDTQVVQAAPRFYLAPSPDDPQARYALAAHEDFSGLITIASPAKGGEIVHFYFTALGPVSPVIATGAVTPPGALYQATTPLSCSFHEPRPGGASAEADILFAGLAPGMNGVDQVDIAIPRGLSGAVVVTCQAQLPAGTISDFAQLPITP
jgi:uncharacterized protein (TIGR03437 family)